jgi:hypothetical protein
MIVPQENVDTAPLEDLLEEACSATGFSMSDILQMMASELETDHLLEYITAVTSNRMN